MENILGQSAQLIATVIAIFFALRAFSGLVNLYLRYNDRLSIDREDIQALGRYSLSALFLAVTATLFHKFPFFMASAFLCCAILLGQIVKIQSTLKKLEKTA